MAKIEDLIAQIPDERLRKGIAAEVKALKKSKKFGLVFEEHLPETVRLPRLPVKPGDLVALKRESGNELWRVKSIKNAVATCDRAVEGYPAGKDANREFRVSDLLVVRNFGDPIYPALVPVDRVERGGPDKPWHVLINADNFHALQLLLYCYESKVDVIYIDPPYNTGARDWKYNNDYVDRNDAFRHSKWLSMMKKRISLAKRLLKPNGILVVAIDDYEIHHLRTLMEQQCPGIFELGVAAIRTNPSGRPTLAGFRTQHDYAVFYGQGSQSKIAQLDKSAAQLSFYDQEDKIGRFAWVNLRKRGGGNTRREARPKQFYPIYVRGDSIRIPELDWDKVSRKYNIVTPGDVWEKHLFCMASGGFSAKLNGWEKELLEQEMKKENFVAWLRNLPRREWAFCIPYELAGKKPFYPDFVIVRKSGKGLVVDVLEPHDDSRTDTWAKAKGLAEFADKHGMDFGRLVIARKKDKTWHMADVNEMRTRSMARKMQSASDLESLFGS